MVWFKTQQGTKIVNKNENLALLEAADSAPIDVTVTLGDIEDARRQFGLAGIADWRDRRRNAGRPLGSPKLLIVTAIVFGSGASGPLGSDTAWLIVARVVAGAAIGVASFVRPL